MMFFSQNNKIGFRKILTFVTTFFSKKPIAKTNFAVNADYVAVLLRFFKGELVA